MAAMGEHYVRTNHAGPRGMRLISPGRGADSISAEVFDHRCRSGVCGRAAAPSPLGAYVGARVTILSCHTLKAGQRT